MAKLVNIKNFRGGLNLEEPTTLDDNQFEVLTNMFYTRDKRIQSRRGIKTFGNPIPDSTILINSCDAIANFAVSDDGANLATGAAIRGTFSVSFDIDVSLSGANTTSLNNTSLGTIDITSNKGHLGFWLFVPTGFNTSLINIILQLGSDSSNYYQWSLGTLVENTDNFIRLNYTDAVITGTPVDANIDFFLLKIAYTPGYVDQTGILIDSLFSYSVTSVKPITSSFFFINDINENTTLLAASGTNMFKFDEITSDWDVIKTGLSEFETNGTTRTRWSFAVYLNVIYMCNGVDSYSSFNDVLFKTFPAQPKVRHLAYLNDAIFGGGADFFPSLPNTSAPNILFFTDALPINAEALDTNDITVGGDEQGRIRGLEEQQQSVIAFKDKQIYSVGATAALPTDTENGGYGDRAIKRVGNSLVYFNDRGFNTLQAKAGITGTQAIETVPLSDSVRKLAGNVINKSLDFTIGEYIQPLTNYYGTFDTTGESIPETTLVFSSLTQGWSLYTFPAFNDYTQYINSDGETQYLAASANTGQMFEIETGFSDLGLPIPVELRTKQWDLGDVTRWKSWQFVDIVGLKSQGGEIEVDIIVDGDIIAGATIDNTFVNFDNTILTVGSLPIGTTTIGGGSMGGNASNASALPGEDVDLFQYKIRIPMYDSGSTIQVRMTSNSSNMVWTLDKIVLKTDLEALDLVPFDTFIG